MIQTTIQGLIQGELDYAEVSGVYIIRDGKDVLYVGRSKDTVNRLIEHIEKWTSSSIGNIIHINAPQSLSWQIELMKPEECRDIVKGVYKRYANPDNIIDIETAEESMIMYYHPCFNTSNNPNPNRTPSHIKRYQARLVVGATDNLF